MVDVAFEDRQAGMAAVEEQADDLVQGGAFLHAHHLEAGHHDFPDQGILELKDRLNEFAFLPGDEAPLFALDDDVLDFAFEIFRLLHGRPAAEPLPEAREEAGGATLGLVHA